MIQLDYKDPRPIYEQLVERIERLILMGVYKENEQLPSVRQLAGELSINPNTIQRAYSLLERSGYIYSVRGQGSFVAEKAPLLDRKRTEFLEEFKRIIRSGRALGVERSDMEKTLLAVFGEEEA